MRIPRVRRPAPIRINIALDGPAVLGAFEGRRFRIWETCPGRPVPANLETYLTEEQRQVVEEFHNRHRTSLLALLFTDGEGSAGLKKVMGELPALAPPGHHGRIIRDVLAGFADAQGVFTAGDVSFLVFAKPSDAVRFALVTQVRGISNMRRKGV